MMELRLVDGATRLSGWCVILYRPTIALENWNCPTFSLYKSERTQTETRPIMVYKIIHHVVAMHPRDNPVMPTTTITRY